MPVDKCLLEQGHQVTGIDISAEQINAIFHIPREEHLALVRKFARMLSSGGYLLVTMGAEDWEGTADFHGVEMFWSH